MEPITIPIRLDVEPFLLEFNKLNEEQKNCVLSDPESFSKISGQSSKTTEEIVIELVPNDKFINEFKG